MSNAVSMAVVEGARDLFCWTCQPALSARFSTFIMPIVGRLWRENRGSDLVIEISRGPQNIIDHELRNVLSSLARGLATMRKQASRDIFGAG
jgi:hypothetical protein